MAVNLQVFGLAASYIEKLIQTGQYKPLSTAQINFLVGRGSWIINAELRMAPLGPELGDGDSNVFAGQGVSDLDTIQLYMDAYPWGRFSVDVGGPDSFSEYVYIGTNDVIRWRNAFIAMWGTVNRPEYFAETVTSVPPQYVPPGTNWP